MNNHNYFNDSHDNSSVHSSSVKIIVANINFKKSNELFMGSDVNFNELSDVIKMVKIF